MKLGYTFDNHSRTIVFDLTDKDYAHSLSHSSRMQEFNGPYIMDALSGVDWEKVQRNFPLYRFWCSDCDYKGDEYAGNGQPRKNAETPQREEKSQEEDIER